MDCVFSCMSHCAYNSVKYMVFVQQTFIVWFKQSSASFICVKIIVTISFALLFFKHFHFFSLLVGSIEYLWFNNPSSYWRQPFASS